MLQAARQAGLADRRCAFEAFTRAVPPGRRYGVYAGIGRILEQLPDFRITPEQGAWLLREGIVDGETVDFLENFSFSGDIYSYEEGELFFPHSPVLRVEGTFAECVVLETWLLSVLNHDCAVAGAASRMTWAAGQRPCLEMGSRRTHELSAVDAARAAAIAGFAGTSNMMAGVRYGLHTIGTAAHAFTLLFNDEESAFQAQIDSLSEDTTLLIDTFDVETAIDTAVRITEGRIRAVRIDSGDLIEVSRAMRAQLDRLGATKTRIVATNDLDEYRLHALREAPIDTYGVGTQVVTGSGHPAAGFVYKLVAHDDGAGNWMPVAKKSTNKASIGGRKSAVRRLDDEGVALEEVVFPADSPQPPAGRELQRLLVSGGRVVDEVQPTDRVAYAMMRHAASRNELGIAFDAPVDGDVAIPTVHVD
ncbi:nicotinate phosphoribosyltransferase [Micrococcales bacterium 31B]|nr:nicotinate phosphoribosyltransferase [Micrococcales bacterium 31B]